MPGKIKRLSYTAYEVSDVAEAANLIAAEARAAGCSVQRPFNDSALEGRPTWTAAHSVMWWHVDQERARDRAHDAERDALRARAEAAEQSAEAAEAALALAQADRALMAGLWLATVPPDVLPALLPADPGDRDRLASALDAVDLQVSAGSHTAAAREVIGRIVRAVAEMAGGAR